MAKPILMDSSKKDSVAYLDIYEARNLISDVGCQWLSKSNWLQLGEM